MGDGKSTVERTIAELAAAFPAAFTLDLMLVRPLKLGIKEDLYERTGISRRRITEALPSYCNRAACGPVAGLVGIDGGVVSVPVRLKGIAIERSRVEEAWFWL